MSSLQVRKDKPYKMDQIRQLLPPEADELLMETAANPKRTIHDIMEILLSYDIQVSPQAITSWRKKEYARGRLAEQLNEEAKEYRGIDNLGMLDKLIHDSTIGLGVLREKITYAVENDELPIAEIARILPHMEKNVITAIESKERIDQETRAREYTLAGAAWMGQILKDTFRQEAVLQPFLPALEEAIAFGLMAIKNDRIG